MKKTLEQQILALSQKQKFIPADYELFYEFRTALNEGKVRAAEKVNGNWQTNDWVKQGILAGFRMGKIVKMGQFLDKDTYPQQDISTHANVRLVPGGSAVREGAYIAPGVIMMPPMYVNVGAYVDEGTMIDSHALVGTCAQIGKHVHLSAASQIGGVLEPIGANPVIIEDNVFIGGNCGIYEGVIVQEKAIIAAGVIITAGTPVFDAVHNRYLDKEPGKPVVIPAKAVVVSGTRPLKSNPDFSVYCPIIIKYRDDKSSVSVTLESDLR
ncbi:MAG TPA: 2,3,4,5-tetrahydropyridine-2,6-dicarboxylate N-succinyltransferase [Candidatus Cloacimonadota bacterium]|nr:2,3,4,5-tetrahydropyridine-2,6-dicarboxylate N-succinyltransferase [Candidatus Cloacimonadota bacterium]